MYQNLIYSNNEFDTLSKMKSFKYERRTEKFQV